MATSGGKISQIGRVISTVGTLSVILALQPGQGAWAGAEDPSALPPVSDQARQVHASGMLFDGHNDLPWRLRTEGDFALTKFDLSQRLDSGQTDIPRLREGGVKAQFWSVYIPSEHPNPARTVTEQIDLVHRMVERYPNVFEMAYDRRRRRADRQSGQDRVADRDRGGRGDREQPGPAPRVLHPGSALHDLDPQHDARLGRRRQRRSQARRPDPFRRTGRQGDEPAGHARRHLPCLARHHGRRLARLSGSRDRQPFERVRHLPVAPQRPRRHPEGSEARTAAWSWSTSTRGSSSPSPARRCVRSGTRFAPSIPIERLRAKAMDDWYKSEGSKLARGTYRDVADHIDHIVKVAGIDHVGIGSDFDGITMWPVGLDDVSSYPRLTEELLRARLQRSRHPQDPGWQRPAGLSPGRRGRQATPHDHAAGSR